MIHSSRRHDSTWYAVCCKPHEHVPSTSPWVTEKSAIFSGTPVLEEEEQAASQGCVCVEKSESYCALLFTGLKSLVMVKPRAVSWRRILFHYVYSWAWISWPTWVKHHWQNVDKWWPPLKKMSRVQGLSTVMSLHMIIWSEYVERFYVILVSVELRCSLYIHSPSRLFFFFIFLHHEVEVYWNNLQIYMFLLCDILKSQFFCFYCCSALPP